MTEPEQPLLNQGSSNHFRGAHSSRVRNRGRGRVDPHVAKALHLFGVSDLREILNKKHEDDNCKNMTPADPSYNFLKHPSREYQKGLHQQTRLPRSRSGEPTPRSSRGNYGSRSSERLPHSSKPQFIKNPLNILVELAMSTGLKNYKVDNKKIADIRHIPDSNFADLTRGKNKNINNEFGSIETETADNINVDTGNYVRNSDDKGRIRGREGGDFRERRANYRVRGGDFRERDDDYRGRSSNFRGKSDFSARGNDLRGRGNYLRGRESNFRGRGNDFRDGGIDIQGKGDFRGRGSDFRGRGNNFRGRANNFRGRGNNFRGRGNNFRGRGDFRGESGDFRQNSGDEFRTDGHNSIIRAGRGRGSQRNFKEKGHNINNVIKYNQPELGNDVEESWDDVKVTQDDDNDQTTLHPPGIINNENYQLETNLSTQDSGISEVKDNQFESENVEVCKFSTSQSVESSFESTSVNTDNINENLIVTTSTQGENKKRIVRFDIEDYENSEY